MTLFVVLHIFICAFLVFVILLQPGKADGGIAFGGSSSQSIFGSKGAGNFLTKTTSVCAVLFLFTSFFLTRSRIMEYTKSVIPATAATEPAAKPATPAASPNAGATAAPTANKPVEAAKPEAAKPKAEEKAPEAPKK